MLVDTHVNLHADAFDEDRDAVLARARDAGVGVMIAICARLSDLDAVTALADAHDHVWATVGAHPHHAKDRPDITPDELIALARHPKVVAIGETGLDNHYGYSPEDQQIASLRAHIAAARETGLPLIVHTREAARSTGDILEDEHAKGAFKILMHSYTSGPELARRAAALGAWFSVNGIATFKKAEAERAVIAEMPEDRIVLETDAPYLAPVPHRGRRCEPAHLVHVAEKLAEIRGWSLAETHARTTDAAFALFDRVKRPAEARS